MKSSTKEFIKQNIRWVFLIVCTLIMIEIIENLFQNEIYIFDNIVYKGIAKTINPITTIIAKIITLLGSAYVIIPIFIVSVIAFRKQKEWQYITFNLGFIFILNQALKRIIARPRPVGYRIVEEMGYSFPSGHSMVSMAFYGLFAYLIYRNVKNKYVKWISIGLISLMIVLIGLSRIYLGVHYASDVVAGFCLSICYLSVFTKFIKLNDK